MLTCLNLYIKSFTLELYCINSYMDYHTNS